MSSTSGTMFITVATLRALMLPSRPMYGTPGTTGWLPVWRCTQAAISSVRMSGQLTSVCCSRARSACSTSSGTSTSACRAWVPVLALRSVRLATVSSGDRVSRQYWASCRRCSLLR